MAAPPPPPYEAVFFDYDGVLVASLAVKEAAFRTLFAELGHPPALAERVVAYHRAHGGLSRVVKIAWAYETLLGQPLPPAELAKLGARFGALVEASVVACPAVAGARATLAALGAARVPCVVVSGTPESELQRIVAARGEAAWFAAVLGSPTLKPAHLRAQLAQHGWAPARCLFVGDALTDFAAAREVGLPFLGIVPAGDPSPVPPGTATSAAVDLAQAPAPAPPLPA